MGTYPYAMIGVHVWHRTTVVWWCAWVVALVILLALGSRICVVPLVFRAAIAPDVGLLHEGHFGGCSSFGSSTEDKKPSQRHHPSFPPTIPLLATTLASTISLKKSTFTCVCSFSQALTGGVLLRVLLLYRLAATPAKQSLTPRSHQHLGAGTVAVSFQISRK
jgi:hypothetical protein